MRNIIVVSDIHAGSKFGLMPPEIILDEGTVVKQSFLQEKLWSMWREFNDVFVPEWTRGEEYIIVNNGDTIDGDHHDTDTIITRNLNDQVKIAQMILEPEVLKPKCKGYYQIRGTEAHVGKSGRAEEQLAKLLNAVPFIQDKHESYSRWDLWLELGKGSLIHFSHHVSGTQSASYESTGVYKELVEAFNEAGRWGDRPPDVVVRSHRHRQMEIRIPTKRGYGIVFTTPAWQLKTPFTYKLGLGRASTPQIGGYLIREGDEDMIYTRFKVWKIERSKTEVI